MTRKIITVANDFSKYPGGRKRVDGPHSAEEFKARFLLPIFKKNEPTSIHLDGVRGYSASFLDEAFGGLVREDNIQSEDILKLIEFVSSRKSIKEDILHYIDNANNHKVT